MVLSADSAVETLIPLFLFVIGMAVYSVFIFKFYLFVSKRDIFELNLQKYNRVKWGWLKKCFSALLYTLEYLILFPIFVTVWFAVFSLLLVLLSKQDVGIILLIAMAIVTTIRVTAYYSEDLSRDVAKMLPFALLGVLLLDISFFSLEAIPQALAAIPTFWETILYYLGFAILVEFVLRVVSLLLGFGGSEAYEAE